MTPPTGLVTASLVTGDSELFTRTKQFYEALGFVLNAEWSSKDVEHGGGSYRAPESIEEDTLVLAGNTSDDMSVVHLRYSPLGPTKEHSMAQRMRLVEVAESNDWRGVSTAIVFPVSEIPNALVGQDTFGGVPVQAHPKFGEPNMILSVDPLGNLIGFTTSGVGVSTHTVAPKLKENLGGKIHDNAFHCGHVTDIEHLEFPASPPIPEKPRKRIAVLTSGGDSPGMNAAVRAVVRYGIYKQCEVFCVMEGYAGLLHDDMKKMSWDDVRGWLSAGGTLIGTARCLEFKEREHRKTACFNMIKNGIDALVVVGGDGSLTGADFLRNDWPSLVADLEKEGRITKEQFERHGHLNIAGLVGSIDNDMAMTDSTIGAYSSLDRICTNVDWIQATADSHSRAFVIEVMGRHCGWLALMAAIATRADYVFLPEMPPNAATWQEDMNNIVLRHRQAGSRRIIVIVAEGAHDDLLQPIKCDTVKDSLSSIGFDTRVTTFGHIQRGGTAVAFDRLLAQMQGAEAIEAILESNSETPSPMIGIRENKVVRVPLLEAVKETKAAAAAIERKDFAAARALRDTEFNDHLRNYLTISKSDKPQPFTGKRYAIVACGAPAGGMNQAVAAAASYCLSQGHKPIAIYNGWSGLARHESFKEISWHDIMDMYAKGGCEIGTNRTLPDVDYGMIAYYFGQHHIDGVVIVGGFEAFRSLHMLDQARVTYPAFRIPMVCLPATISNNVPGTENSLGTDTCLNALLEYCDIVKQSASSTRRRVFVVEVQGAQSGYIASMAGLITGSYAIYLPETGISLTQMHADIKHLRNCFAQDQGRVRAGRLVVRNEMSSPGFTTANLTSIFETESHGKFDAREAIPGHLQQGGMPSPMDHVRAVRYGIKCIEFLEKHQDTDFKNREAAAQAAAVFCVRSANAEFWPVAELWDNETEVELRRGTSVHWQDSYHLANILTNRPIVTSQHIA